MLYFKYKPICFGLIVMLSNWKGDVKSQEYGIPMPDPNKRDNHTFKARIPDVVTMTIHAAGNPTPTYEWLHNGIRLNSSDTNYKSTVTVRILEPVDFGKYMVNITNIVGTSTSVYMVIADGPPDAVSNLNVSNITETSANITFTSGYDYNDTQTFVVKNYTNGRAAELASVRSSKINDGGEMVIVCLNELQPSSNYNITVVARNSKGQSKLADSFLYFKTLEENHISSTGLITAISSGIVVFIFIFCVLWYLKTKTRMLTTLLEQDDMTSNRDNKSANLYRKHEAKAESKKQDYGAVSVKRPKTSSGAVSGRRI